MNHVGPGWSPTWRTHSCVPCRDSSRHLLCSLTRCASHARGPGVEKSNRRSLRDRLWRHKPRFGATAPSCISLQVLMQFGLDVHLVVPRGSWRVSDLLMSRKLDEPEW